MATKNKLQTLPETKIVFTFAQLTVIITSLITIIGGIIGIAIFLNNQMKRLESIETKIDNIEKTVTRESGLRKKDFTSRWWYRIDDKHNPYRDSILFYDPIKDELFFQKRTDSTDYEETQ
jgi:hypothetical protein